MAAEAQLRTMLTLCDPEELARVERVAVNDAVFWSAGAIPPPPSHIHSNNTAVGLQQGGNAEQQQRMIASSLLVDVLQLLRARLPGLRELVFVPRDENPLYSGDACLVEPTMAQSRLARVVREAMGVVFSSCSADIAERRPWDWKILALSADADVPVYGRHVLGWETTSASYEDVVEFRNAHGPGYTGRGSSFFAGGGGGGGGRSLRGGGDKREWAGLGERVKGREFVRMNMLQESVRRQFMQMEMGGKHAVPVLVE